MRFRFFPIPLFLYGNGVKIFKKLHLNFSTILRVVEKPFCKKSLKFWKTQMRLETHFVSYAFGMLCTLFQGRRNQGQGAGQSPPPYILAGIYKQNLFLRTLETSPFRIFRPSYGPVSLLNWQNVDVFLHSCLGSG